MRTSNSIKNAIIAIIMNIIIIISGFIMQKIFLMILGSEYLGLNGLYSNILSMLSVIELGFGTAIIYHLYQPVADNDEEKINSLMTFYKKIYRIIAIIILIAGILLLPFLNNIVGNVNIEENIHILFFISLMDIVFSYLLTYKRSILYANQKAYITNIIHIIYIIGMSIIQAIFLYATKNYTIYLIIKVICRIFENIIITIIANKLYPFICDRNKKEVDSETKKDIYLKVKGLIFHRIGASVVLGTDNIIISKLFGIVAVGLYSNYYLIINAVSNLFGQAFSAVMAVVGNLLITEDSNKSYSVYKDMLFLNSWIYCFSALCIGCLIQPVITLWVGKEYLLTYDIVTILVVNFYMTGMRKTNSTFKEAAGIFYEDRYVPLLESFINIVFSVILGKMFGVIGVFIGTFLSSLVLFLYSYPIFVYKKLFNQKYIEFIKEHLKYMITFIILFIIMKKITDFIQFENMYYNIIVNLIICISIPNLIYILIYRRTKEFENFKELVIKLFKSIKYKNENEINKSKIS